MRTQSIPACLPRQRCQCQASIWRTGLRNKTSFCWRLTFTVNLLTDCHVANQVEGCCSKHNVFNNIDLCCFRILTCVVLESWNQCMSKNFGERGGMERPSFQFHTLTTKITLGDFPPCFFPPGDDKTGLVTFKECCVLAQPLLSAIAEQKAASVSRCGILAWENEANPGRHVPSRFFWTFYLLWVLPFSLSRAMKMNTIFHLSTWPCCSERRNLIVKPSSKCVTPRNVKRKSHSITKDQPKQEQA